MYYDDDPPGGGGCVPVALIVAVALLALGGLFYFGINRAASSLNPFSGTTITNPLAARPTTIAIDRPAVLRQMQGLNRWETATGNYDKVITAGQEGSALYNFFRGDKLILIANGDVVAGFDMSKLQEQDVIISSDAMTATITMPPAEILLSRLDNDKTYVYNRETGIFNQGNAGLESEARRVAEQQIVQRACETELLTRASAEGKRNMENLVKAFGIKNVIVNVPAGPCIVPPAASQ